MLRFLRRFFGRERHAAPPPVDAQHTAPDAVPPAPARTPPPARPEGIDGAPITGVGGSVVVRLWRAGPFVVLGTTPTAAAEAFATLSHHPDATVRHEAERALAHWPDGNTAARRPVQSEAPSAGATHSRGSRRSAAELMQ